jgi:hypothetical protein
VAFVNLPVLLGQIAALAVNGRSPFRYLPQLLLHRIAFSIWVLAPAVVLAAVTANLVQVGLTVVAAFVGLYFILAVLAGAGALEALAPGSAAPVIEPCKGAIVLLCAAGICALQYSRRVTSLARWLVVCGVLAPFAFQFVLPWGEAFALIARQSPIPDPGVIRLARDPEREPKTWLRGATPWIHQDIVGIAVPIQVAGIPDGLEAYSDRILVTVEGPGGETWSSGWNADSEVQSEIRPAFGNQKLLPGDGGPYSLFFDVNRSFCRRFCGRPVHLRATVAFVLLGTPRTTRLTPGSEPQRIPGDGFCYMDKPVNPRCFAPLQPAAESVVQYRSLETGVVITEYVSGAGLNPVSSSVFSVWDDLTGGVRWNPTPTPVAVFFETRQAVAHFERVLDLPDARLAEL